MSDFLTLAQISGGELGTAPRMFSASTNDLASAVTTAGYVSDLVAAGIFKDRDIIYVNYDVDGTPGSNVYLVDGDDLVGYPSAIGGALLVVNNLDDLGDLATALANLGLGASDSPTFVDVTVTGGFVTSAANAISANAGGGQGSATALTKGINRVTVVATAGDSVLLPDALAGVSCAVINADSTDAMDVFPKSGEVINALSANTALSVAANKTVLFLCAVDGTWNSILTA